MKFKFMKLLYMLQCLYKPSGSFAKILRYEGRTYRLELEHYLPHFK